MCFWCTQSVNYIPEVIAPTKRSAFPFYFIFLLFFIFVKGLASFNLICYNRSLYQQASFLPKLHETCHIPTPLQ